MERKIILMVAVGLVVAFLVLFGLAMSRRGRPGAIAMARWATGMLGVAGLLMILVGVIGPDGEMDVASGFLMLVGATGIELGKPTRKKG